MTKMSFDDVCEIWSDTQIIIDALQRKWLGSIQGFAEERQRIMDDALACTGWTEDELEEESNKCIN